MKPLAPLIFTALLSLGACSTTSTERSRGVASSGEARPPLATSEEQLEVGGRTILLINHADAFWDDKLVSQAGVEALFWAAQKSGITTVGLVSDPDLKHPQFYPAEKAALLVQTPDGHHRLQFPEARNLLFAGGNLSICLCETIRDALLSSLASGAKEIDAYLVSDAIFDSKGQLSHALPEAPRGNKFALANLISYDQPPYRATSTYISRAVYNRQLGFCLGLHQRQHIPKNHLKVEYYVGDRLIASEGKEGEKLVRIRIMDSSSVKNLLPSLVSATK